MSWWGCGVAKRAARIAENGGRFKGDKCHAWAVGRAENVSEAHVRSSVMYARSGVAPGVVTRSGQAWGRFLRIMPPAI